MSRDLATRAPSRSHDEQAEEPAVGRAALTDGLRRGGGAPLPGDVAAAAAASFGGPIDQVRVHTDAGSDRKASSMGMQAFARGTDVHFKAGAYDPSSSHGRFVLMHELAHVAQSGGAAPGVQGKAEVGDSHDSAEVDADRAAEAAMRGEQYTVQRAEPKMRGFGATAKRDETGKIANPDEVCHENQTVNAATSVGLSEKEAAMVYSGNWQRDMNQFLIPKLQAACPEIYEVMNILHAKHFGFTIPGQDKEFGTYDPSEHLDAPGGLTAGDVFDQNGDSASGNKTLADATGQDPKKPLADADQRYVDAANAIKKKEADKAAAGGGKPPEGSAEAVTANDMAAFKVDESAIPVYLQVSRTQLKNTLNKSVNVAKSGKRDLGLRMAGEALHTLQDYYAHSNFCEVAVNLLLDAKFSKDGKILKGADAESGVSLVDLLQLNQYDPNAGKHKLNSYVHAKGQLDKNLATAGGKEVISTGSFSLKDTMHSVKEKVTRFIQDTNPFAKGQGGMGKAVAIWIDSNPKYAPGMAEHAKTAGKMLKAVVPALSALTGGVSVARQGGAYVDGAANAAGAAADALWNGSGGILDRLKGAGNAAGGELVAGHAEAQARKKLMDDFIKTLEKRADALAGGEAGACAALVEYVSGETGNVSLAKMVREIPLIGKEAAELVEQAEKDAREWIRKQLEATWEAASKQIIAEIDAAVSLAVGDTEEMPETHSKTMSTPTHTDIAKDFDKDQQGAEDTFSVIEEVAEIFKKKGMEGVVSTANEVMNQVNAGDLLTPDGLHKVAEAMENADPKGPEDEPHRHQHRHGGAWLAPLASSLATRASAAVLTQWRADVGDTSRPMGQCKIDEPDSAMSASQEVDRWFVHPADNMGLWQGQAMAALQATGDDGVELRKELARRTGKPPSQQAPNDHQHDSDPSGRYGGGGHGHDDDHDDDHDDHGGHGHDDHDDDHHH